MTKSLFIILLLSISAFAFGNNADSLKQIINNHETHDSTRVKAIRNLVWKVYMQENIDSAIHYGMVFLKIGKKNNNMEWQGTALNGLGSSYRIKGEYMKAAESLEKCAKIFGELGDDLGEASALGNLGILYMGQAQYGAAIKNFIHCRKVFERMGNTGGMLNAMNYIGGVYIYKKEYNKARAIFDEALGIARREENAMMESFLTGNIGLLKESKGELDSALFYFYKAIELDEKSGNKQGVMTTKLNLASAYLSLNDLKNAKIHYEACLEHYRNLGEKKGISMVLTSLSEIELKNGNITKAKSIGIEALKLAEEVGAVSELSSISNHMYTVYKKLGNFSEALKMHELHLEMKDSLQSEADKNEVLQQSFQFKYDQKVLADSLEQLEKDKIAAKDLAIAEEKAANEKQKQFFFLIGIIILVVFGIVIYSRLRLISKQKSIIQEQKIEVEQKRYEAELQKEIVESKNKEIVDSINYAKRLQGAILPDPETMKEKLNDYFLLYKPKDIVAGDFYWLEEVGDYTFVAVADSTGHGVPGAMVSVVCSNALSKSVIEEGIIDPGKILDRTRELVVEKFNSNNQELRDGMDISLARINFKKNELDWAGANINLWLIREGEISLTNTDVIESEFNSIYNNSFIQLKSDKQPIGKYERFSAFRSVNLKLKKGDTMYFFSDGIKDQFGGVNPEDERKPISGKKLKTKNLKNWILKYADRSLEEQKQFIDQNFENWKGDLEQLDDVCMLGLRV